MSTRAYVTVGVVVLAGACGSAAAPSGSIAAVLEREPETGRAYVRVVPAGRAADTAGLLPGDRIKMVDGVHVDDLDSSTLVRLLRGPIGSRVSLTVIRGESVFELEVRRQALGSRVEPVPTSRDDR